MSMHAFRPTVGPILAVLLLAASTAPLLAQQTPVVIAVDTSRSLAPSALEEAKARLRAVLETLGADTPTALLAFDDEPVFLAGPGATPAEVAAALDQLSPQGNFTLLNDALFVATRALPDGGVIVLVTDGRDENSAVLVDDIARRSEAQNVRILTLGSGASIAERALRRLALVSDGDYLGPIVEAEGERVAERVAEMRREVASTPPTAPEGPAPATVSDPQTATAPSAAEATLDAAAAAPAPESVADDGPPLWWLWVALALLAFLALWLVSRRRAATDDDLDDDALAEQAADEAEAGMIRLDLAKVPVAEPRDAPEVTVDTAVFQQMSLDQRLEHTRVMSNHGVLLMRRLGERPRTFMLDDHKSFSVGRDRHKNTLAVPDPALSSQHFRVVPRDGGFFFLDLESTNGSFINGRRVAAKRLRHGDRLRAGQVEFEFQSFSNV